MINFDAVQYSGVAEVTVHLSFYIKSDSLWDAVTSQRRDKTYLKIRQ
jgi:hypothetical protein